MLWSLTRYLGVARFFADGQFALIQAVTAQNDASIGLSRSPETPQSRKGRGPAPLTGAPRGAHTGLVVARFFADEQFALIQAVTAQNDASIGLGRKGEMLFNPQGVGGGRRSCI